ncbi:hypothetical protein [Pseudomonas fluorescens]|uniref:hypothetical protein n=1 Tax=Pseudomonas fluorescens TaxID=294 RepID=UPI00123F38CB|nr:hypothetical protein [Pseudomonas fluorescens]
MTDTIITGAGREPLNQALKAGVPLSPSVYGAQLIRDKWGADIAPLTTQLATLDYNYHGHPAIDGVQQGRVRSTQSLVQALLGDYQAVADDRFGETAFGFYTPPAIGQTVKIVEHVDEFAYEGNGNHEDYEGIYRQSDPQTYGPETQIAVRLQVPLQNLSGSSLAHGRGDQGGQTLRFAYLGQNCVCHGGIPAGKRG